MIVKAQLRDSRKKPTSSIAISVAIHVVVAAALMSVTFRYPLGELFDRPVPMQAIPVRYIALTPEASSGPVSGVPAESRSRALPPATVPAPSSVPVGVPAAVVPAPSGAAIGAGGAGAPSGSDPRIGFGIRPGIPDGRLATNPMSVPRAPETEGQMAERALSAIYGQYLDSARAALNNPNRKAGDWSWGGKDGDKWGWDEKGIHVGGITIPNMVLAALPINVGPGGRNMNALIDARNDSYMRSDISYHSGLMSEDEFRAAVRRVRERVDRERREKMEKAKEKGKPAPCCS